MDVTHEALDPRIQAHPRVRLLLGDSADSTTVEQIRQLIPETRSHGLLLILNSDHTKAHVLRELNALVPLLRRGDYLIVEDTIVNGHPVRPDFGPGPLEALDEFLSATPRKLEADFVRESKFGCTFASRGYFKVV